MAIEPDPSTTLEPRGAFSGWMALIARVCIGAVSTMAVYTLWADKSPSELGWTYVMWTLNGAGLLAFVPSLTTER